VDQGPNPISWSQPKKWERRERREKREKMEKVKKERKNYVFVCVTKLLHKQCDVFEVLTLIIIKENAKSK
jgi:hypothetical protein